MWELFRCHQILFNGIKNRQKMLFFSQVYGKRPITTALSYNASLFEVDSSQRVKGDEIQPIVQYLFEKFQRPRFIPFDQLLADEIMIGYKKRLSFKQYMPKKPTKWELVAKTLADADARYLLNMKMSYGKDETEPAQELTKTFTAIVNLLQP